MPTEADRIRTVYRVRDWNNSYELNRSREIRVLEWVPFPNRLAELSYIELVSNPNGAAYFGVWHAVVYIASRCVPRGTLLRNNSQPLQLSDIAAISRLPEPLISEAMPRFIDIGWLEQIPLIDPSAPIKPTKTANGSGKEEIVVPGFDLWWSRWVAGTERNTRQESARTAWAHNIKPDAVPIVMKCLENYLASGEVARDAITNPDRWLSTNAKDKFSATWPAAKKSAKHSETAKVAENLKRMNR